MDDQQREARTSAAVTSPVDRSRGRPPPCPDPRRPLLATILHQGLSLPQAAIAALLSVRPETINGKRIRAIRQLLDQAGRAIQPGPHRLASLDDLYSLATAGGITVPPEIKAGR